MSSEISKLSVQLTANASGLVGGLKQGGHAMQELEHEAAELREALNKIGEGLEAIGIGFAAMEAWHVFAEADEAASNLGSVLRATGNALDNFDGRKFLDGKTSFWTTGGKDGKYGSTLIIDLNHRARPKLCATYERTLRQSEVMRAIVVLRAGKDDMVIGHEVSGPDRLATERRGVGGLLDNDQFFNVFDTAGVEMDALGVFVFSGRGKDHGLSEIELYE